MDLFSHYNGFHEGQRVRFVCLDKERTVREGTILGFFDQGCPPCCRVDAFVLDREGTRWQVSASKLIIEEGSTPHSPEILRRGWDSAAALRKLGLPSASHNDDGCVRLSAYDAECLVNMVKALYASKGPTYA